MRPRRRIAATAISTSGCSDRCGCSPRIWSSRSVSTYESWAAVENLLLTYDELGPAMTVVRNV